jgi:hypothetical protein
VANNPLVETGAVTVANPGAGVGHGAAKAVHHLTGGSSQGDSGRNQRELEDRRRQVTAEQGVDPRILALLNSPYNPNASTDQLLDRYGAVNEAGTTDAGNFVRQIYGDSDRLQQSAYDEMKSKLGRAPTSSEYSQLLQAFQGPNGLVNGRAAVSQYFDQIQKDPTNPNSPLNPQNPGYQKTLQPHYQAVTDQFKSIMGRDATQDELTHFGGLLASGQTDAYGLQNFLKQQPEYTNAQDQQFRSGLNDELSGYDTKEFGREKGDIMADYARRGFGTGTSPSLDYALTDLMGKLAENRSAYLSTLSAQQYGNNKSVATGNYQNSLNQMYDQNQQNRQRQNSLTDYYTQRGNEGADYMTQMNDYLKYQNQNKGSSYNPLYGAAGGVLGAGIGAAYPALGPQAGFAAGGAAGNAFGYLNR